MPKTRKVPRMYISEHQRTTIKHCLGGLKTHKNGSMEKKIPQLSILTYTVNVRIYDKRKNFTQVKMYKKFKTLTGK